MRRPPRLGKTPVFRPACRPAPENPHNLPQESPPESHHPHCFPHNRRLPLCSYELPARLSPFFPLEVSCCPPHCCPSRVCRSPMSRCPPHFPLRLHIKLLSAWLPLHPTKKILPFPSELFLSELLLWVWSLLVSFSAKQVFLLSLFPAQKNPPWYRIFPPHCSLSRCPPQSVLPLPRPYPPSAQYPQTESALSPRSGSAAFPASPSCRLPPQPQAPPPRSCSSASSHASSLQGKAQPCAPPAASASALYDSLQGVPRQEGSPKRF